MNPRTAALGIAFSGLFWLGVLVLAVVGCAPAKAPLGTGAVVSAAVLPGWKGDASYAVVNSAALPRVYDRFRGTLSDLGLVKWDARFDCNRFAGLYVGVAQAMYGAEAWHSDSPAQALALAEVWYMRDAGTRHAVVQARTERGDVFIEPQTGAELRLSGRELASIERDLRIW